jgi:hypothetical protein
LEECSIGAAVVPVGFFKLEETGCKLNVQLIQTGTENSKHDTRGPFEPSQLPSKKSPLSLKEAKDVRLISNLEYKHLKT